VDEQGAETVVADRSQVSDIYMTVEQYLTLDEATDAKYEFENGYVFMVRPPSTAYDDQAVDMAGGSVAHADVCAQLTYLLVGALRGKPCRAYTSDARMKLAERQYYYPDITVACGQQTGSMLQNPTVVIEVLSPATEKRDRGAKFKTYKTLPTMQEYMLVGSEKKAIELYRREGDFWRQYHYREGDLVELTSLGVRFPSDEVYYGIDL
jgi:Uma2 family endonuclease